MCRNSRMCFPKDPHGIGIGVFQDGGLISESGFRPILPSDNNSPILAFSVYENQEQETQVDTAMERMDSFQVNTDGGGYVI